MNRPSYPPAAAPLILGAFCLVFCAARGDEPRPAGKESPRGALVICGGGRIPEAMRRAFVDLAGGPKARIVVVPTASEDADAKGPALDEFLDPWRKQGVASVTLSPPARGLKPTRPASAGRSTRRRASGSAAATSRA
jgi:hypothetical protein